MRISVPQELKDECVRGQYRLPPATIFPSMSTETKYDSPDDETSSFNSFGSRKSIRSFSSESRKSQLHQRIQPNYIAGQTQSTQLEYGIVPPIINYGAQYHLQPQQFTQPFFQPVPNIQQPTFQPTYVIDQNRLHEQFVQLVSNHSNPIQSENTTSESPQTEKIKVLPTRSLTTREIQLCHSQNLDPIIIPNAPPPPNPLKDVGLFELDKIKENPPKFHMIYHDNDNNKMYFNQLPRQSRKFATNQIELIKKVAFIIITLLFSIASVIFHLIEILFTCCCYRNAIGSNGRYRIRLNKLHVIRNRLMKFCGEVFMIIFIAIFMGVLYANMFRFCQRDIQYYIYIPIITVIYYKLFEQSAYWLSKYVEKFAPDEIFWVTGTEQDYFRQICVEIEIERDQMKMQLKKQKMKVYNGSVLGSGYEHRVLSEMREKYKQMCEIPVEIVARERINRTIFARFRELWKRRNNVGFFHMGIEPESKYRHRENQNR